MIKYRNASVYVQRQIDRILRNYRNFAKVYIDDIMIFSTNLQKHLTHLPKVFNVLTRNNIFINSLKTFFEFVSVNLLKQHVTSLKFLTNEQKFHVISNLTFSINLNQLKTYVKLTK